MTERKQAGIPGKNIIWKVAFRTVISQETEI